MTPGAKGLLHCSSQCGQFVFLSQVDQSLAFFSTTIVTENPSWISINMSPNFYYDGDCNDPNVQANISANFIGLMTSNVVPPFFCLFKPDTCNVNTVDVACGDITVPERRRRRRSVRQVRDFSMCE